jgi:hypothetical protein
MSTVNQTLQQLLTERVTLFADSDRPLEIIDKAVEEMFKDVIKDAFRSYGDMGKAVKEAIAAAMPANVSDIFELTRYNALIADALKQRWHQAAVESTLLDRATAAIDEVLSDKYVAGEVSLRKLFEAFIEHYKDEAADNHWEAPDIRFRDGSIGNSRYLHIHFDEDPEGGGGRRRSDYQLGHALHVALDEERTEGPDHFRQIVQVGRVYAAQLDYKKIAVDMQIRNEWERILASLYFGNAKLLIDCGPDEFSYGLYD